jgi:hypothetical protein
VTRYGEREFVEGPAGAKSRAAERVIAAL